MNYFEYHIGDYESATAHLSVLEDGVYSRLLRVYYRTEQPIPADLKQTCRLVRAVSKIERDTVQAILGEFFELRENGWHNVRCDEEIARYQDKQRKARASAEARWSQRNSQSDRNANAYANASDKDMRTHSEGNATRERAPTRAGARPHTPDTNPQSPDIDTRAATATDAGRACLVLRRAGIADTNPGHPDLLALIAAGASDAEFQGAAEAAAAKRKGFAYALGTLKRQRMDAAELSAQMHRGPMPTVRQSKVERQISNIQALTGKDRHHAAPAAAPADTVDVDARVVD